MMHVLLLVVLVLSTLLVFLTLGVIITSFLRRKDPLPADMLDGDLPGAWETFPCLYLATYREGWSKPVSAASFLQGGRGLFYLTDRGVNFLIDGSRQPVFLPNARIVGAAMEAAPSGPHKGKPALVVTWNLDAPLRSAFLFTNTPVGLVSRIEAMIR